MKYVKIANGAEVSAISLGCMRMNVLDEKECQKIIASARELGINHFDHADIYGGGRSEELFGKVLKDNPTLRSEIILQSKCGIRQGRYDFSKEHIISSVDGILKRLNTDRLDLLLLHRPDTLMEPDEVAEAFSLLESSGKVVGFGVSNFNLWQIELLKSAVKQRLLINQLQFSLTEAGMITSGMNVNMKNAESVMHDGGLLEYSRFKNITIQAWSPMQYGFFEGVYVGNREKFPELNDALDTLAEKYSVSPTAIAFAWMLRHPANMQVIAGTMNEKHLKDLCVGADVKLTREEWYDLYRAAGHFLP